MKQSTLIISLALMLLSLAACKSRKISSPAKTPPHKITRVDSVYHYLQNAEYTFKTLKGKFSGIYHYDDQRQNFSGQFRIKKDSLIWCSITVMNIEVARVMLSKDSLKMLNRLNKSCIYTSIDYINQQLQTDIDFDMLQALLVGNDIPYYEDKNVFALNERPGVYLLSTPGRHKMKKYAKNRQDSLKVIIQKIFIDKNQHKIVEQQLHQLRNPNKKIIAHYSDFRDETELFPHQVQYKLVGTKNVSIDFEFSKIVKDEPLSFPFKVPHRYQKIRK